MTAQLELNEELHQTLKDLMAAISGGVDASEEGPGIPELIRRIDEISGDRGRDLPKMLHHYLEKRSYAKALDFLEGRDETAAPNC